MPDFGALTEFLNLESFNDGTAIQAKPTLETDSFWSELACMEEESVAMNRALQLAGYT
jgi:hypothetical protein